MPFQIQANYFKSYLGLILPRKASVRDALDMCFSHKADFVLLPVETRDFPEPRLVDIRDVSSELMGSSVIGIIEPEGIMDASRSYAEVSTEIEWAVHAGMHSVVLRAAELPENHLTRIVSWFTESFPPQTSLTRLVLRFEYDEWEMWNRVRTICNYPPKLFVWLGLPSSTISTCKKVCERWLSEPVSMFNVSSGSDASFEADSHFVLNLAKRNAHPVFYSHEHMQPFVDIMSGFGPLSAAESYVAPFYDSLQLPLQPLADHMENTVYETFEGDRTKYDLYEEAIFRAAKDLLEKYRSLTCVRIAVVGAGRGGLIDASIRAIQRLSSDKCVKFEITGVEKNPHAARTLKYKQQDDPLWLSMQEQVSVRIVHGDMRNWCVEFPVDILVSELLGSLGDNEASPECLDSVTHVLHPERGVSIPSSYYSTLEPISSHKIWAATRDGDKFETPLVVLFHSFFQPCSSPPVSLFSFTHGPGPSSNLLSQSRELSWYSSLDAVIHGFAGYFHAELFPGVVMSIDPPSASKDMVSWFPAFLPLRTPIFVKKGDSISVRVDRVSTQSRTWIQWTVLSPHCQPTNNANGSRHSVGL